MRRVCTCFRLRLLRLKVFFVLFTLVFTPLFFVTFPLASAPGFPDSAHACVGPGFPSASVRLRQHRVASCPLRLRGPRVLCVSLTPASATSVLRFVYTCVVCWPRFISVSFAPASAPGFLRLALNRRFPPSLSVSMCCFRPLLPAFAFGGCEQFC